MYLEPCLLLTMQISNVNDVKIYNLSHGKSLPEVIMGLGFYFGLVYDQKLGSSCLHYSLLN